jgi:putative hemolysin
VLWARAEQIPTALQEIGRLREITFRAVGEGTGRARDLDAYDQTYRHLFLWAPERREIVGAYRLITTKEVRSAGSELYTQSLFEYGSAFLERLGPAIELGRSFVRPEYQGHPGALAALWQGIGRVTTRFGCCPILFGAVSISASYSLRARALMRAALLGWGACEPLGQVVRPRTPFAGPAIPESLLRTLTNPSALERAIAALYGAGLPVLVRRYLELGGRFVSFNVDRAFREVLDGLVIVDLRRSDPRLLRFYLGPEGYQKFGGSRRAVDVPARASQRI